MPKEKNANNQDSMKGLMIFVSTFILIIFLSLFTIYLLQTGAFKSSSELGTLGDFIGGLMNPLLSFVTVLFLIYTIKQNQEMIKQNQRTIELNTEELGHSTKALQQDAKTNNLKFHFELIDMLDKQIQKVASRGSFPFENQFYSFSDAITSDPGSFRAQCLKNDLVVSIEHMGEGFDIYYEIQQLYSTFLKSLEIIIDELPAFDKFFLQHPTINLIKNLKEFIDPTEDDIYIALQLNWDWQKTQDLLIERPKNLKSESFQKSTDIKLAKKCQH